MKGLGIKYQLRLTTLIPVLLVAVLFAVIYNGQFSKDLTQHMSRLGESYIRQLLPAAQLAMMRNDRRILQGLIDASTINPEIISLAFYNADGQLIAYRGGKHSINKPIKPLEYTGDYIESTQTAPYSINFLAPITIPKYNLYTPGLFQSTPDITNLRPDDILGWLSIDLDTKSMIIKRYQMYIITIFITLVGLLVSLSIHYFLSRRLYLPIARLRRSMKQILSNEFETHIAVTSKGELGLVEKGCAHLQKQYLDTVRDLNHHIEVATEDLQQSLELLEEKNIELTMEKKKTEEKSRQKSEFIANMSHEIRTPMNGVIGFTNVLLESKLDPLQLDYVKTIKSSAQDLLTIINDILDYSKMDAGKLSLDCIPLDLRACIDEVLTLAAPNAHKKGIDLIPSTDIAVPKTVLGDPIRIKQILTNLVNNAIKFTERGYVLIKTVVEQESEKDYSLCISVTDTGIGISAEDQTKLFNAFNQADTTITRRFGGSGLGLVICKKLAEEMKGRITLTSELHKGSTFTVRIRLEKFPAYEAEKHQNNRFDDLKAICFDDNPLHLEGICNGLEYCGIHSVPVTTLKELEQALTERKDCKIALVNVNDGCEEQIAGILKNHTTPTILISKTVIHDPQSLGGCAFLFRPISIQKLQDTIESLLNQKIHNKASMEANHELDKLRAQLRLSHPDVLIAEDNPVNRMLLQSFLNEGAQVETVQDGEEAVKASLGKRYNIILLDLQMPKLGGIDAAKLIHQDSLLNKSTPIVIISADQVSLSADKLKQAGIHLCLQKPIEEKQFLTHLLQLLTKNKTIAIDWQLCIQKVSGNQALAEEFLTRFVAELRKNRQEFIQLFHNKDIKNLEKAAHKLHGACCFCGVPRLQSQVTRLENQAGTAQDIKELETAFAALIRCIDDVLDEFDNLYNTSSSDSQK
ncbi:two-component system sensor histidine kinase LetS [Legionella spiritensis]|uniref:histidine kinase n=1 Tax=Legionella spiritensis TaxID=452 RepID=A0A0W0Z965_LEGSP|nr:ATP-binding protein [Legionella spiritensis]KTD65653.1 transmission sensor LetS [Legionella spiritensis]SNV43731.1 sensory box histidine kinase/response regulator [Legionella spiritensis]VEG90688.1 sensory box histidine kinase/response regulator [Legionella spiritensis]